MSGHNIESVLDAYLHKPDEFFDGAVKMTITPRMAEIEAEQFISLVGVVRYRIRILSFSKNAAAEDSPWDSVAQGGLGGRPIVHAKIALSGFTISAHSCPRQILGNYKNGEALTWGQPLIFSTSA